MDISISHLRQHLPEYLARVRHGERMRVTSRGRVVAELVPPAALPAEAASARERLRGGLVRYDDPTAPVLSDDEWQMQRP